MPTTSFTPQLAFANFYTEGGRPASFLSAAERGGYAANGKGSLTISEAAYHLTGGDPGWARSLGQAATVSYAYRASAPTQMPDDAGGFSRFNSAQIAQAELALQAWSDVANIRFVRVGSGSAGELAYSNSAPILFGNYATGISGASAFAYYPGSTSVSSPSGDVWVNSTLSYNQSPAVGNYGGQVLAHEIGHAIGLSHPGDYDAGETANPTYANSAGYYEDSRQYTVMSYFSESNTGGNFGGRHSAAPLLDDIAAVQLVYGANMSTRAGDTTYGFNSTAGRPWYDAVASGGRPVFAVWDAGGVDTLDFSGFAQNQTIDLRAGFFSSVGGLVGNVAIAQGATIENAVGGSGGDHMTGNEAVNRMFGQNGGDTLSGGGGQDYLRGELGADWLSGGAEWDDLHGNMGADTVYGGDGDDWVVGGQDNDVLYGEGGRDLVYGNLGADTLTAGDGADVVLGGQNEDVLYGGAGDDVLSGDRGADTESGGAGADVFSAFVGAGLDRVIDFSAAEGDRVQLLGVTWWEVLQSGADTVIQLGGGDQLVLVGVNSAELGAGWLFQA
jgi:serralysin